MPALRWWSEMKSYICWMDNFTNTDNLNGKNINYKLIQFPCMHSCVLSIFSKLKYILIQNWEFLKHIICNCHIKLISVKEGVIKTGLSIDFSAYVSAGFHPQLLRNVSFSLYINILESNNDTTLTKSFISNWLS